MAKAVITEVTLWNDTYEAKYYSGAKKFDMIDKMPQTVRTWIEKHPDKVNDWRTETAEETATTETETETEITPATAAAEYMTEIPEIIGNQINGFDFWYDTNLQKFVVLYCGDEVIFDSVVDAWKFSAEMRKAEEDAEVAENDANGEEPEQGADEEPETVKEATEEPETATTPAAMVPIIQEPVRPAAVTPRYTPASEAVMFSLCMVLMYAALVVRYGVELLIIAIQNIWSHREEYAEKVRMIFREQIRPAAVLAGYMAKDTATAAAIRTVETGKQIIIAVTIITFMVGIYNR